MTAGSLTGAAALSRKNFSWRGRSRPEAQTPPAPQRVLRAVLSAKFQDLLKSKFTAEGAAIYEEDNTTSIHPAEPAPGKHSCAVASIIRITMHGNTEPNCSEEIQSEQRRSQYR